MKIKGMIDIARLKNPSSVVAHATLRDISYRSLTSGTYTRIVDPTYPSVVYMGLAAKGRTAPKILLVQLAAAIALAV